MTNDNPFIIKNKIINISRNIAFDFENDTEEECYNLYNKLLENNRRGGALALLGIAANHYTNQAKIFYLFSQAFKKSERKRKVGYLEKCLEIKPNHIDALKDIALYKPEYCDKLIHNAHILRSRNLIGKSDNIYKKALAAQLHHDLTTPATIIHKFLENKEASLYLEIGAFIGMNFLQIRAAKAIAIDNNLRVPGWRNNQSPNRQYFKKSLSEFLLENETTLNKESIDCCFINNYKNYKDILETVEQLLHYVKENFLILIPNCNPTNFASSQPTISKARNTEGFDGEWRGDIYKAILTLRNDHPSLDIATIQAEGGLVFIQNGSADSSFSISNDEIQNMDFDEFKKNATYLLNIKDENYFDYLVN